MNKYIRPETEIIEIKGTNISMDEFSLPECEDDFGCEDDTED